jgi:hypothetical protein
MTVSSNVWHLVRAFSRQELEYHAGREAQVIVQYAPGNGWYEFRIMAGSREGLSDVLDVLQTQIDRMRRELSDGR